MWPFKKNENIKKRESTEIYSGMSPNSILAAILKDVNLSNEEYSKEFKKFRKS